MKHIRWIWRFWRPHLAWLWIMALLTLLSSAVAISYPLVFRYLLDNLSAKLAEGRPELAQSTTTKLIMIMLVIGVTRSLANFYPGFRALINAKLEMDVRQFYFNTILGKGFRFFNKFRTGDLVTRLTDDIGGFPKIAWFCCSGIFRAVESSSKFIFCLSAMLWMNWELALLSLLPLPFMLFIFYRIKKALALRSAERQKAVSRTNDALEAAFSGVRIVKAFNAEAGQAESFREIMGKRIEAEQNVQRLWIGVGNLYQAINAAGQIIVIVAGGLMVVDGTLSIGEFYAFYVYLSLLLGPLTDIPQLFVTSRQAFASIDREIELETTPGGTETDHLPVTTSTHGVNAGALAPAAAGSFAPLPRIESLELRAVSFRYDEGLSLALDGISLSISAGQRLAIVGAVGSGKSSLVKLAAGILRPDSGVVLVNGRPLADYAMADYRRLTGYIPQEATLFSESVADNVRFGRNLDIVQVRDALQVARVLEEMELQPQGIETVLGQRGLTVSGGQKQRLAIARALAGRPDLLLMDDCTSALDAENERAFWELFRERLPDSACIIVTHRLSTARQADLICMLEKGRVVGLGTDDELLESCEPYRSFHSREELALAVGEE